MSKEILTLGIGFLSNLLSNSESSADVLCNPLSLCFTTFSLMFNSWQGYSSYIFDTMNSALLQSVWSFLSTLGGFS